MVRLMAWFAEKVSSVMGLEVHVDISRLKATLPVTAMMVNISLMKPEGLFQTNCITGKIIDKKFLYIINDLHYTILIKLRRGLF